MGQNHFSTGNSPDLPTAKCLYVGIDVNFAAIRIPGDFDSPDDAMLMNAHNATIYFNGILSVHQAVSWRPHKVFGKETFGDYGSWIF